MKTYRIAHESGKYCHEVEGVPIPNDYGVEVFLHRYIRGGGYAVSEVMSGAAIWPGITDDAFEAVRRAEEIMERNRDTIHVMIKMTIEKYGPVAKMRRRKLPTRTKG